MTAVRLDDHLADRETPAHAVRLRCISGTEQAVAIDSCETDARIAHGDSGISIRVHRRPDGQASRTSRAKMLHRLDAVAHEIQHDLAQLHAVTANRQKIRRKLELHLDVLRQQRRLEQDRYVIQDLVHRYRRSLEVSLAE